MRKLLLTAASATALIAGMRLALAQDLSQPLPFTLKTKPSTSGGASANIPPGTAPTSPNNGDLWTTITGLWAHINGTNVPIVSGPALSTTGDIATFSGTNGQTVTDSGFSIATMFQQASTGCWETYCVDSVHGSDSNPGTAAAPFQTFAPLNYGASLTNAQSIGLACGSIWKATLATANQSVLGISAGGGLATAYNTVAAYNYGGTCSALPILDGSAIIPNAAFTAVGGSYPNLYYAGATFTASGSGITLTVSPSGFAGVIEPGYTLGGTGVPPGTTIVSQTSGMAGGAGTYVTSAPTTPSGATLTASPTFPALAANKIFVWETGAPGDNPTGQFMSLQTSESGANASTGSYYIAGYSGFVSTPPTSGFIYVHPYDGSSAITSGYTYEVSMQIPFTSNTLFDHVTGIEGRKTGSNTGVFNFEGPGGSVQLSNCIARDAGRHHAILPSGSTVNNCEFIDFYDNEAGIAGNFLVFHENSTSTIGELPLTVNNSVFEQNQVVAGNGGSGGLGIYAHTDDPTSMGTVSLNNDWYIAKNGNVLGGFGFSNVVSVTANRQYGSQIYNLSDPNQNLSLTNSQVVTSAAANDIFLFQMSGVTVSIDNSKFCASNMGQGVFRWNAANNDTLNVTNSFIYGRYPNAENSTLQYNGGTGTTYYFYGDDFGSNAQYWSPLEDDGSGNIFSSSSDYNIYESQGGYAPQWFLNATNKSSLATWQSLTAADSHSTENGGAAATACKLSDSVPEVQ